MRQLKEDEEKRGQRKRHCHDGQILYRKATMTVFWGGEVVFQKRVHKGSQRIAVGQRGRAAHVLEGCTSDEKRDLAHRFR